jgi:cell division protein FtsB
MRNLNHRLRPKWPTLIFGMLLTGLGFDALYGPSGPRDLLVLRQHASALAIQLNRLHVDNAAIRDRIARLRTDDSYLELVIREDLGYVRPGELVYRFPKTQRAKEFPSYGRLDQPLSCSKLIAIGAANICIRERCAPSRRESLDGRA